MTAAPRVPAIVVAVVATVAAGLAGVVSGVVFTGVSSEPAVETAAPVAAPASPSPLIVDSVPVPTWKGARRTAWANDGSKTIGFTLDSTRDVPVWMSYARPVLGVRCLYRSTDVFVVLDTSAAFEGDADRRTVRVQWDDEPVSVQQWAVSETGRELFAPDGIAFVRRMVDARRLRFGFTPFNAQPVTVDFAVEGFAPANLVANTCGWRLDPENRKSAQR